LLQKDFRFWSLGQLLYWAKVSTPGGEEVLGFTTPVVAERQIVLFSFTMYTYLPADCESGYARKPNFEVLCTVAMIGVPPAPIKYHQTPQNLALLATLIEGSRPQENEVEIGKFSRQWRLVAMDVQRAGHLR
jgi:hypothetical protein